METYLLPEDVAPKHARQVLEFLNAAQTAEEIATAVELPNERDVGLRVAARLLAQREAVGGFESLDQVLATPYVGPERFTEIVVTLSGARPPQPHLPPGSGSVDLAPLLGRLAALEASIGGDQIRLDAVRPRAFLGRRLELLAQVRDAGGQARINVPVTFVATWGRVSALNRTAIESGQSVVTQTDHAGIARVLLDAPIAETLTEVQRATLDTSLAQMDVDTPTPRAAQLQLTALARAYRLEASRSLRAAIDVYFRDFGERLYNSVNPRDTVTTWDQVPATVMCYAQSQEASKPSATALTTVRFLNWLPAWAAAFRAVLTESSQLGASLGFVVGDDRDPGSVLGDVFGRVRSFVNLQQGEAGALLGGQFAESTLNGFLQTNLDRFPQDSRRSLLTTVNSVGRTLDTGNLALFSAVEGTRANLKKDIDFGVRPPVIDPFPNLDDRLSALENTVVRESDLADVSRQLTTLSNQANALDTRVTGFDNQIVRIDGRIDGIPRPG